MGDAAVTHPPGGPSTPPPPGGPRVPRVTPIDPDTPAGRAAADALSQALAEIRFAIWQRTRAAASSERSAA